MKVKRMGITEILRRMWLFSANKIKSSESVTLVNNQLNSSLRQKLDTNVYLILDTNLWCGTV